jgi:uncharacterized GH25 family protein
MRGVRVLASLTLLLCASLLVAHDTWLLPLSFRVPRGARVTLELTSGMSFPSNETAIAPERVDTAAFRLAGRIGALATEPGTDALRLHARLDDAGLATIWVSLKPRTLDLTPAQVDEYLPEIGAPDSVRAIYERGSPRRWRENYRKYTKTFVQVGNSPTQDASWFRPVGQALELVPNSDPTMLRVGATLTVTLLRNGAPLAGLAIGAAAEGEQIGTLRTTDANGSATFTLIRPGRWMLRATELRRSTREDLDWESDFATLTFAVRAGE